MSDVACTHSVRQSGGEYPGGRPAIRLQVPERSRGDAGAAGGLYSPWRGCEMTYLVSLFSVLILWGIVAGCFRLMAQP